MSNKATLTVGSILVALALLAGCAGPSNPAKSSGPLQVLAVETFLGDITQNIAGDRIKVDTLIPIGMDPHAFEPTPTDIAKITDSSVLIINGAGLESWLSKTLEAAGGEHQVIEASQGLTSRTAREGEAAVMTDADLTDAICAAVSSTTPESAVAGKDPANPLELPAESGLFTVSLVEQPDGTFGGYLKVSTDENGDFQIAVPAGIVQTTADGASAPVPVGKTLSLSCSGLSTGLILPLDSTVPYTLALSGFKDSEIPLLIGPAGGQHHHEGDPHFWLDPTKVITYVENIRDGLIQADPAGKDTYTQNAANYIAQLKDLDSWIAAQAAQVPLERRVMVTNHESFGYFADRYGFTIIGTIIPSVTSGASPSAQEIARLIDRIQASAAPAIFLETGANTQLAEQIAQQTGIKVVTGLYTHSTTKPDGEAPTYIDMMKFNALAIVTALK